MKVSQKNCWCQVSVDQDVSRFNWFHYGSQQGLPEVLHLIGNITWWSFFLFHMLTVDEKGETVFKNSLALITPLVLSPPYHHQVLLWRSSVVLFFLSKNCLPPHRSLFYHRPDYFLQHLWSPLLLLSPTLCEKESSSKSERKFSQICSHSFNTKEHLLKRWSRRVCLLIGYPLASLNLATFAFKLYCSNFCRERNVGIEPDDKSFLIKELLLLGM